MSQADQTGDYAPEIPSKHHPPVPYRDMPDPLPLKKVLGPSVVAIAIGLASGEFILWPYITSKVGLGFLWAAILGLVTQYFVNMEIERYTLATGETAITGFPAFGVHGRSFFRLLRFYQTSGRDGRPAPQRYLRL